MSRGSGKNNSDPRFNGGIGSGWLKKYETDVYPDDFIVVNGRRVGVPRYYDKKLEVDNPDVHNRVVRARNQFRASIDQTEKSLSRLRVREKVTEARVGRLKREMKK